MIVKVITTKAPFSWTSRWAHSNNRFLHCTPLALAKLNVEGLAQRVNLDGQNVLMRVDLNVPLSKVFMLFPYASFCCLLYYVILSYIIFLKQ
jgi:hypothetical protein